MIGRILLVDEDVHHLGIVRSWLEGFGHEVLTATDGSAALTLVAENPLDVVVADLLTPSVSGRDLVDLIKELQEDVVIVILAGRATLDDVIALLRGGNTFDVLLKPLKDLTTLSLVIERALVRRARRRRAVAGPVPAEPGSPLKALTGREREVLAWLAEGISNKEIANRLYVSEKTVRNHLASLYSKLGVRTRIQAALTFQRQEQAGMNYGDERHLDTRFSGDPPAG